MASLVKSLPVAVIGAGPVGLAAAAHLIERGLPVRVYERGAAAGANLRDWAHVRTFSPWSCSIDEAAQRILMRHGWRPPDAAHLPTGGELIRDYLHPLSETPELAAVIETGSEVTAVTRQGIDKVTSKGRDATPFSLTVRRDGGSFRRDLARAVIDASGTWTNQNPLGAAGLPAEGEAEHADSLAYGMPDALGRDRNVYAGRTVFVVGAGYSAANVLLNLTELARAEPRTSIAWIVRGANLIRVYGGELADQLPARGELGGAVRKLVDDGRVRLVTGFRTTAVRSRGEQVVLVGDAAEGPREIGPADRIIVATGQRPDLMLTRELRLELDPWLESAKALGPLIDPNVHSCGSVPPHGHRELAHPEPDFYTIGVKSYGRAPTFLLLTGYEQARSVAAALAGDFAAADDVRLVLPETGVCSTRLPEFEIASADACCGGPASAHSDACCVKDAVAKAAGDDGCGCSPGPAEKATAQACCGVAA
jgi:thioredoxin reductase